MDDRERLLELFRSMQSDLVPSLVRVLERDDLQLLHAGILQALDRGGEPTVKELAGLIGRSVSRTSRLLEQLVARGLVERDADRGDRRIKHVRISGEGQSTLREIQRVRVEAQLELWEHLTESERTTVLDAMELLAEAARRYRNERG